jgi:hypothetical protein
MRRKAGIPRPDLAIKLSRPMPIWPMLRSRAFYQTFDDMISLALVSGVYPEWGRRYTLGRGMSTIDRFGKLGR